MYCGLPAVVASKAMASTARGRDQTEPKEQISSIKKDFILGLTSGAGVSITKQIVLYPFDTVRTRLQVNTSRRELFRSLYNTGIVPPLLTRTPASAFFFACKDVFESQFRAAGIAPSTATTLAVLLGQFPKWLIRAPAERLKTRSQAANGGLSGEIEELQDAIAEPKLLFDGYFSNVAYAFPHDAVKFVTYDALKRSVLTSMLPTPIASVIEGAIAGVLSELVTSPLDVTRTRVMSKKAGVFQDYSDRPTELFNNVRRVYSEEGMETLFAGITPKLIRALIGGALQFATLELVKSETIKALK
eukprot:CAMPEP_0185257892 /NCGR_PEP_ID=MMETSP1359-20130426/6901_1 /TAXON_ID=552665 /ORGANISM="Bigelowiella longifila, Strain CCMP242" /LENGTH=301 /DNA_ID=CAMNT_0027843179 /DNA_START=418 /DNA_END=1323 /DNA_ORIENTATION=+